MWTEYTITRMNEDGTRSFLSKRYLFRTWAERRAVKVSLAGDPAEIFEDTHMRDADSRDVIIRSEHIADVTDGLIEYFPPHELIIAV